MKVAWISHQWPREDKAAPVGSGLLPGRWAGGAEFLQEQMRLAAPDGIEFVAGIPGAPDLIDVAADADRIIIASPESLSIDEMETIGSFHPAIVWMMTVQPVRIGGLLDDSHHPVWASSQMREWHVWAPGDLAICGYFPTSEVPCRTKRNGRALWAARNHPLKGRLNARVWALDNGYDLDEITDAPREDVLAAMASASVFVHRPIEKDPCPTTVSEALIAGCEIAVNGNVGRIPADSRDSAIEHIESLPDTFYGLL